MLTSIPSPARLWRVALPELSTRLPVGGIDQRTPSYKAGRLVVNRLVELDDLANTTLWLRHDS